MQDAAAAENKSKKDKTAKKSKKIGKEEGMAGSLAPDSPEGFRKLMQLKYMTSLMQPGEGKGAAGERGGLMLMCRAACFPGEAVGVLAAQSIGEPSTQVKLG